jgi:hypothetical protein
MVCADRSDHVHIPRAAHTGHVRAERFGDLHGERTHASRRTVDQDYLPWLNPSFVAKALQGSAPCHWDGRRLLECDVGWFQRQSAFVSTHILGEGAATRAEDLITRFKLRYVPADRFNLPGDINPQACGLRFAQPAPCADDVRRASHVVPVKWIDGSGANSDQDYIAARRRLLNVFAFENIR